MSNLGRLSKTGIPIEIRIPVIPGFNANRQTFENIGDLLSGLSNITVIKLLPFHALARSKYDAIGYTDTIPIEESPSSEMMNTFSEMLTELGLEVCS
jgi:pyruvate formate lyase activating enzyme